MISTRAAGILLHVTSLPGPDGIGDAGPGAHTFVDDLAETGSSLWQVLPLGPTGYGDSPYQCFSAFAGNPLLVSADLLADEGLLQSADLADRPSLSDDRVDYGRVIPWKLELLDRAYRRLPELPDLGEAFRRFQDEQQSWLPDFALFMALKDAHGGRPWVEWSPPLRERWPEATAAATQRLADAIDRHRFRQFAFFRQWERLRAKVEASGITLIGDIPIFVAHDSVDVWTQPHLFDLLPDGRPRTMAGVPPDYFSPTGQLWGNPLYRWDQHAETGYGWWIQRFRAVLDLVHVVRLDHFRGFAGYWEVPAGSTTAVEGRWVPGPGAEFLTKMGEALGDLPIIAEDLGEITPDVIELRDQFGLPGMKILQFGFATDESDEFLPHNFPENCVAYTGTHDNDTSLGWLRAAPESERRFALRYLGSDGRDFAWDLIKAAWHSPARLALAPMQDLLSLGTEARMNYPSKPSGNWTWRMERGAFSPAIRARLARLNRVTERSA